jgi:hypothetical protein
MQLSELLKIAGDAYPDGPDLSEYLKEDGTIDHKRLVRDAGDTLLVFIAIELAETFDKDASERDQLAEASRVMDQGVRDLESVWSVLNERWLDMLSSVSSDTFPSSGPAETSRNSLAGGKPPAAAAAEEGGA